MISGRRQHPLASGSPEQVKTSNACKGFAMPSLKL
jgi:hypothetical protein